MTDFENADDRGDEDQQVQVKAPASIEDAALFGQTQDETLDMPADEPEVESTTPMLIPPSLDVTSMQATDRHEQPVQPAAENHHVELQGANVEEPNLQTQGIAEMQLDDSRDELPLSSNGDEVGQVTTLASMTTLWRRLLRDTQQLSFTLSESLRLVLEPTLANRLRGDYRSGKRLNMRKIIPYIASDYTKDKIWLRRTKPSQREYQILLAVDDSKSMADSRSVDLAFQTLALVMQSLGRLEAGQVGVCSFGKDVHFVQDFSEGSLSEQDAARMLQAFTFQQTSTDVRKLLEQSLQKLHDARASSRTSASELWQLQIIVSDGMCQNLEEIRALLRKAREERIVIVFLIIDSLTHNTNNTAVQATRPESITTMQTVSYEVGQSGSLELKMQRYMDTFPFEYYIILRDISALPSVLGDTLRQFFERVSN